MADFVALYQPNQSVTRTTSGAVTGGQALVVSGDGTVAASSGASAAYVGLAGYDAGSGALVTVLGPGDYEVTTTGTVTAGDLVTTAAAGVFATQGAASAANDVQCVGVALTTAASNKAKVRFFR